jgi:fluoroquinolone transport system permease protein
MTNKVKIHIYAFRQFLYQIRKDAILLLLCVAPVLCGVFFRYGIPAIEDLVLEQFGLSDIMKPYYLLFDLMLGVITPLMYCFASAYLILGEIDEGISNYMAVTPLGKKGYLVSRLGIPTVLSAVITMIVMTVFSLTDFSLYIILSLTIMSSAMGYMEALLIVAISGNRVEGMAVSKISGLLILGLPAPFFITGNIQFLLSFLPSFWASKFVSEKNPIFLILNLIISFVWITCLYHKFERKII